MECASDDTVSSQNGHIDGVKKRASALLYYGEG